VATIRGAREACADALDFSRRSAIACARQQLVDVLRRDITPIAHIPSTFRDCQVFIRENSIYAQPERMTIPNQIEPPFFAIIAKNRERSSIARILVGLANQLEEAQSAITLLASKFSFIDGFQSAA